MTTNPPTWQTPKPKRAAIQWLLDSDPSIRWQAMRDLTDASDEEIVAERAKIATDGWGATLLAAQSEDGTWPADPRFPEWPTLRTLLLLHDMGLDPANEQAKRAVGRVRENVTIGLRSAEFALRTDFRETKTSSARERNNQF